MENIFQDQFYQQFDRRQIRVKFFILRVLAAFENADQMNYYLDKLFQIIVDVET